MSSSRKCLCVRLAALVLGVAVMGGCATGSNPRDPFEPVNRRIYDFNEAVDRTYLQPIAYVYKLWIPQFVRSSVSNFFSNINDIIVALNNLLQGKFTTAYSDLGRVAMNTTLGIGGLFDVATEAGIERHEEDFGQTLGWWGMGDGPFIMLPLFGPSNGRDLIGRVVDYTTDVVTYVDPARARNQLMATRLVNRRAELLDASTVLQTAALDPYEFVRDAYLQRRRNLIYDGSPPPDKEFLDPPAAPKKSTAPLSPFPSTAEPTGSGSVLVSGETKVPVQAVFPHEPRPLVTAPPPTSAVRKPAARVNTWVKQEMSRLQSMDPLAPSELEALAQAPQSPAGTSADALSPTLARLWRSLAP